ncbi:hypothetical protein [Piscinibacter sakaiensis]|uniref:hypothetical protein n=1 Tax=Piscinibacter sakaiensis TaxID=1547922 RepID=UPI003AB02012
MFTTYRVPPLRSGSQRPLNALFAALRQWSGKVTGQPVRRGQSGAHAAHGC